jgi:hypothetical protein
MDRVADVYSPSARRHSNSRNNMLSHTRLWRGVAVTSLAWRRRRRCTISWKPSEKVSVIVPVLLMVIVSTVGTIVLNVWFAAENEVDAARCAARSSVRPPCLPSAVRRWRRRTGSTAANHQTSAEGGG